MVNLLLRQGYVVVVSLSVEDAIQTALIFKPHCIFADFFMADANAIELVAAANALLPDCKILITSDQARAVELLGRARAQGLAFRLLQGPAKREELLGVLAETLAPRAAGSTTNG